MFNNPLKKYQQGGQVSQEQQQMLAAFVEWLPKRVKEFQGMQPEQIIEALNGMTKSPEGQKQVQAYMQQFQQEMQNTQAGMFENGGKLQDFICKHAKGGHVAGCGCKEDGGTVTKAQKGESLEDSAPEYLYNENGVPSEFNRYTSRPGRMLYAEVPTPKGNINFEFNQLNKAVPGGLNLPVEYDVQTRSMLDDPERSMGIQRLPLYQMPYFSKLKKQGTQYEEDGGVVKGQEGLNIPAEPPTGYNGEIRQYIDRRNPIRRRIDIFVENNPYARKIVSLGKGIKESPLGILLPDFSNGVAGAVAPAAKISKISSLDKKSKAAMDRILSGYREYREDPFKAGMPDNFTGTYSYSTERPFGLSDDPFGFYNNGGVIKQNTKK